MEPNPRIEAATLIHSHVRQLMGRSLGVSEAHVSKESLVDVGKAAWEYTYKNAADENQVQTNMADYVTYLRAVSEYRGAILEALLSLPEQQLVTLAAARWWDQGLPVVRLGHKRAAALMATDVSKEAIEFVHPPFRAFLIELPDGLISLEDEAGEHQKALRVLVHVRNLSQGFEGESGIKYPAGDYWSYVIFTEGILMQWRLNRLISEVAGLTDRGNLWTGYGLPTGKYDDRVDQLVGSLVCSTCLMMSNPDNLSTKFEPTQKTRSGKKPTKGCPQYKVFTERKPINVDVRRYISAYLHGERDSPHVRLMVRGHHKMQHHGPQRSLRKLIWIEPYSRGGDPNDPIMNSIYQAKDKPDADVPSSRRDCDRAPDGGGTAVPPAPEAHATSEAPAVGG